VDTKIDWQQPQATRFKHAMDDDFNTPEAMAVLFDLANEVNKTKSLESASLLKNLGGVLGLLQRDASEFLQGVVQAPSIQAEGKELTERLDNREIDSKILERIEAKKTRNFVEADRIRKELADAGIVLEDSPLGTTWRRA
jgi:cysteinyl-tRNA synthetase